MKIRRNNLVVVIALNKLTNTPIKSVSANPLTKLDVKRYKIMAVMIVEILESRIDGHARRKPSSTAPVFGSPRFNSSLIRSKISTFASTAMPMVSTNPASPARDIVKSGMSLKSPSVRAMYMRSANDAKTPNIP